MKCPEQENPETESRFVVAKFRDVRMIAQEYGVFLTG